MMGIRDRSVRGRQKRDVESLSEPEVGRVGVGAIERVGEGGRVGQAGQDDFLRPRDASFYSQPKGFVFLSGEVLELLVAWVVLSLAFGVLYSENDVMVFVVVFPICFGTVGLGFILHELSHKFLAQRYGFDAVFKANWGGLGLAVLISFFGFVIVTPGGVYIRGLLSREQNGRISAVGPLMNLLLAVFFLGVYFNPLSDAWIFRVTSLLGYEINAWIGLFNLIPSPGFDGSKIKDWNILVYLLMVVMAGGLYLLSYGLPYLS